MVGKFFKKLVGSRNDRQLRRMGKIVARINALEGDMQALDDASLKAKTAEFRERVSAGESLDDLLPEAFAVVREAGRRVLEMRHFDVQLIGGMALHEGQIAEMRTGEGKTLVATLPAYLNALTGHGVHIVTVNDYLARRDAEWMGQIFGFLGMTTGVVVPGQSPEEKRDVLRLRHRLRHQQRVRLRLPARQHGLQRRGEDAGRAAASPSSTRWTRSSSTRRARRSSSPGPPTRTPISTSRSTG